MVLIIIHSLSSPVYGQYLGQETELYRWQIARRICVNANGAWLT